MKRTVVFLSALALLLLPAACSQKEAAVPAPEPAAQQAPAPVTVLAAKPDPQPSPEPPKAPPAEPKTTLSIAELAEGVYTGTLSGDSWANSKGTVFPTIPSAELTVTVQDGQVTLYCEAQASADGKVEGVATPHSPEYTVIISGSLPLAQSVDTVVSAEGEVPMLGESLIIHYDNGKFTRWEVKERKSDSTYHCTVSITMANGIPVAQITVDGGFSHQTATVPLALAAPGEESAEASYLLWTNADPETAKTGAKDYYVKFVLQDCTVTGLTTYHYAGGKEPGKIMLYGDDKSEYGPFQTVGQDGPDGAANACWVAAVNLDLPAGRYAIADSDQATWSSSEGTDGWGMAAVRGRVKDETGAQASPFAAPAVENKPIEIALCWSAGTIQYTGAVDAEGLPDGRGTGVMEADAEGASWDYTGMWEHGHLCGQGELTNSTENYVMSGLFKQDQLNGRGTQTQNGVLRYDGEWLDGDMHGQGKLYTRTGALLYEGAFDHSLLAETQTERQRRAAPFIETCEELDKKLYAKLKDEKQASGSAVAVRGTIAGMSEQAATGTVIIHMNDSSKYPVALSYRYGADEAKMTEKSGDVSAWGYCVGMFSYTVDGKPASCPQIEVVYWTAK